MLRSQRPRLDLCSPRGGMSADERQLVTVVHPNPRPTGAKNRMPSSPDDLTAGGPRAWRRKDQVIAVEILSAFLLTGFGSGNDAVLTAFVSFTWRS
mmetsp:Transcript_36185/g.144621  ORF Transcript_36185/g.144621 Transcript_36185/m.144621 type:complete len:96 (-) Transcript_36185:2774-3061(-)